MAVQRAAGGRLIGRERELAELEAALDSAEGGRGSLVVVAGEPGIGKTRLGEAFTARALARGAKVVWGRAWGAGGAPAFWPWIEVLRELLGDLGHDDQVALGATLSVASELLPELHELSPRLAPPPRLDPTQARFRLFDAVAKLLRWAARALPIVVVLDDLHAADPATLALARFVARGVRSARVLLVGTFRDDGDLAAVDVQDDGLVGLHQHLAGRVGDDLRARRRLAVDLYGARLTGGESHRRPPRHFDRAVALVELERGLVRQTFVVGLARLERDVRPARAHVDVPAVGHQADALLGQEPQVAVGRTDVIRHEATGMKGSTRLATARSSTVPLGRRGS